MSFDMDELKFLLVGEIQENAELIQQQLIKEFSFSFRVVKDRQEYIQALRDDSPDIILSSLCGKMPDEFWALTLRNEHASYTPFIVISPTYEDETALRCINGGASNYLSEEHLVRLNFAIKMALNQNRLEKEKKATEKELSESLKHFRQFVEHDIAGDYLEDNDKVLFCNDKVLAIFEFDNLEELNAFGSANLYRDPADREALLKELKAGKKVLNHEFNMVTKNGRPIIVLENAYADFDENGKVVTMHGYLIDITEQRESEKKLHESETIFRTLTESTSAGIVIYDKELFLYVNPAFSKLMGFSQEEMLKMHYWDIIHPDHRQMVKERGARRIDRKEVEARYQFKILTKEGDTKWVDYSAATVPITYQGKVAAMGTIYDITEQKNAAQEIKKLSTVIEQSPLSVIITNTDGKIEYVNRAFLEISGFSMKDVLGKNPRIQQSGETPKETFEELWSTITSGMVWKGNLINKKKDGTVFTEIAVIFPVFGDDGSVIRYAAIKRDVTQEKKIEQELLDEKKKAEEANQLKTGILTNMSHELRTPLNGILGFSTLISDSNDLEEVREMTLYIQESGQRLLRTLNLIIEISAMEAGNFDPDYSDVDLYDVIRKTIKDYKGEAEKKNLEIIFEDPLTSYPLHTDLKYTHGAIENLVENAIKFTNEGFVKITVERVDKNGKDYVVINVIDTGIGISEKNQKSIFEDFQQESMGYNRVYEGTGLGLSLSKKYVELLGGYIDLKSKVGEGSTFSIYIPVNNDEEM